MKAINEYSDALEPAGADHYIPSAEEVADSLAEAEEMVSNMLRFGTIDRPANETETPK